MIAKPRTALVAFVFWCVCATGSARADGSLADARALYDAARYEDALTLLNTLRQAPGLTADATVAIEERRAFCLLGLGRATEAETALTIVIRNDPRRRPDESSASPRVRAIFRETRARLLPELVRREYAAARAIFDRREYAAAAPAFERVLALVDDPDMANRSTDLRVLIEGFRDLSAARTTLLADEAAKAGPTADAKSAAVTATTQATSNPPATVSNPPEPRSAQQPVRPAEAPPVSPPSTTASAARIYSAADGDVAPPMAQTQHLPAMERLLKGAGSNRGVVELVINERGDVETAVMKEPVQPEYDALVVAAAKRWKYTAATYNGVPVKYRRMVYVTPVTAK